MMGGEHGMARRTIELEAGRTRVAAATSGSARPRRLWSRWMKRALAPHKSEMAVSRPPITAADLEAEAGDLGPMSLSGA